ncbi:hypothetical protein UCRNP2_30 [Neofusicoccum parvum UCRNP2]|uniref:Uncharacterized protein n=1 Tax=Botryosphaeria parva (strain UCR-NP2) TaxID=1287680 RepID=R1GNA5_BOTPV|nr:hypothetical protein UCRNP2_30 [Neofusicoccum parvum UCRNP2]
MADLDLGAERRRLFLPDPGDTIVGGDTPYGGDNGDGNGSSDISNISDINDNSDIDDINDNSDINDINDNSSSSSSSNDSSNDSADNNSNLSPSPSPSTNGLSSAAALPPPAQSLADLIGNVGAPLGLTVPPVGQEKAFLQQVARALVDVMGWRIPLDDVDANLRLWEAMSALVRVVE